MPLDKSTGPGIKKPITPALSSRFRNTRTPIAPRLAASTPASPAVVARKDSKVTTSSFVDDPAASSLSDNVTPRSGARLSRTGTDSPGTPSQLIRSSTASSVLPRSAISSPAAGPLGGRPVAATANNVHSRIVRRTSNSSTFTANEEDASKFFYVGDINVTTPSARLASQATQPVATSTARKGEHIAGDRAISPNTLEGQNTSPKDQKFFRANELSSTQTPRARPVMAKQSSSTSAASFRNKSPVVSRQNSALSPRMSPQRNVRPNTSRPGSPIKNIVTSSTTITSSASPAERRNSIGSNSAVSRQSATSGHKKSASISTVTRLNSAALSPPLSRLHVPDTMCNTSSSTESQPSFPPVLASPDTISPRSASLTSSKTVETATTSETEMSDLARILLAVKESQTDPVKDNSEIPPKPTPLSQSQLNAANARRERKVLDLEISNSSLLAINKTLERELRKQSAEIRRFRRLSRNGRLSLAPTNRSVSAQSMLSALSERPEEDEEEDFDSSELDDDEESEISEPDEELSDTDSITARSRRRAREERRLMLDLSKHRQLLIDSQKLSQSIRKCVNLTEDLIKDGQKALEYKVGIGDVKLGGRVLNGDEFDTVTQTHEFHQQEGEPRRGLLSPSLTQTELHEASMWLGATQPLDGENVLSQSEPVVPLESFEKLRIAQDEPG